MPIQPFGVTNLHPAEDELSPFDQTMNVIANAHVNHAPQCIGIVRQVKGFPASNPSTGALKTWLALGHSVCKRCPGLQETVSKLTAGKVRVDFRAPLNHETMDAALKARQPFLAKVFINRAITHWVLVVEKKGRSI